MNWRAIGSATSGGLVWASPDSVTRRAPHDLLAADEHVPYRPLAGGIDETADRIV